MTEKEKANKKENERIRKKKKKEEKEEEEEKKKKKKSNIAVELVGTLLRIFDVLCSKLSLGTGYSR
jgi:hypothetical protein